ncbi:DUF6240 domain-containing protein [Tissierella sp.]|uniref:DUF6240 domain-containing protein n=1 Tax=Tissierella sp. TaxID=41274 RepID=UPI00286E3EB2|nr:DUF6240 domain-containing protein [Tissierella sp.]
MERKKLMEMLKINNKDNIINSYGIKPTLPYDVEGVLVEKKGKDIKIEKTIDNKTVEYSLRLMEEIDANLGEQVKIEKEDIISSKVEEKEDTVANTKVSKRAEEIIRELGLEYTEENLRMIEHLLSSGIAITKENINSYVKSKEYLNKIIEGIDKDSFVKLMDRGIDFEEENLQRLSEALEEIKNEKKPFSLKRFLRLERELTYKEAEEISKEIYGQKMGKDVYDTIIALHKGKIPITRENIDKTIEVMSKIHNLKSIKDEIYVKVLNEDKLFNIDNLYKLSNSYTTNPIEGSIVAKNFEAFTITSEATVDSLKEMLVNLDIENSNENISILREFIVNDMLMDRDKYNQVVSMKEAVKELTNLLGNTEVVELMDRDIDPLQEDIHKLVEELKNFSNDKDIDSPIDNEKTKEVMSNLEKLGSIKDKELLQLLKNGEDFTLKSIKEIVDANVEKGLSINHKVLDKTTHISHILNTLGERISGDVISLAVRRYSNITLENLYTSQVEVGTTESNILPVGKVQEGLIYDEYLRARNSLTTNMVKESIKEGKILEHMPLNELNNYMDKKINRYREIDRMAKEIKSIKGHEERILPMITKNGLPMTLKEINDINSFLNGEKALPNILKGITDPNNPRYDEELKDGVKLLQDKISTAIKNGDESIKESYKELINSLSNSNSSFSDRKDQNEDMEKEEYFNTLNKISNKDIVLQLPIEMDNEYKSLNIIIPNSHQGIDKNNMKFYISLETENLGPVTMDISIKGKEVLINLKEKDDILSSRMKELEVGLDNLGYTLAEENDLVSI